MLLNCAIKLGTLLLSLAFVTYASAAQSRCQLPEFQVEDFERWRLSRTYEYDDPSLGVDKRFDSRMATANLYVYDLGLSQISSEDVRAQLDQAVGDALRHYHNKTEDNLLIGEPNWMPDAVLDEFRDWLELGVFFNVETKQGRLLQMSMVGLGELNGCFHKIRFSITFPKDLNEDSLKYSFYQIGMIEFYQLVNIIDGSLNGKVGVIPQR